MGFLVKVSDLLENSSRFAGFLAVIFTSQSQILQQFMSLGKKLRFFVDFVIFLSFHFADWNSFQKAVIFWKKSTRFAGFLAVIFTSQRKNLQKFMHSEKNLEIF